MHGAEAGERAGTRESYSFGTVRSHAESAMAPGAK